MIQFVHYATSRFRVKAISVKIVVTMDKIAVPFERNCSAIVCGGSGSGKTTFIVNCIKNKERIFNNDVPRSVHYFYGVYQTLFDKLESDYGVTLHYGIPTEECLNNITETASNGDSTLIIIDDLMEEVAKEPTVCRLFTQGCHHRNLSTFFLTQNLYFGGKYGTTLSRNSHYYIFTKSPGNNKAISILANQLFSPKGRLVVDAYNNAMKDANNVFVMDVHPRTEDTFRLRSNIFGDTVIYKL